MAFSEETITLRVHPLFGQPILVLRRYGPDAVWAELQDGRLTILPIQWTSLRPRPKPLRYQGRPVRLAPEAVRALAGWVTARLEERATARRALDVTQQRSHVPLNEGADAREVQHTKRGGAGETSALVGEVGAPRAGGRGRASKAARAKP